MLAPGAREPSFGWSVMEGNDCFYGRPCDPAAHIAPAIAYPHVDGEVGHCAVVGGYVYRGAAGSLPEGTYLYADYCSGTIWAVPVEQLRAGQADPAVVGQVPAELGQVLSFGSDDAGELYLLTSGGVCARDQRRRVVATAGQAAQHRRQDAAVAVVVDLDAAVESDVHLEAGHAALAAGHDRDRRAWLQVIVEPDDVEGLGAGQAQRGRVLAIPELQRQHTHAHQVGAVDTLERLGQHGTHPQQAGALGGPVARGPGAVLLPRPGSAAACPRRHSAWRRHR